MSRTARLVTTLAAAALVLVAGVTPAQAADTVISPADLPLAAGSAWAHPFAVNNAGVIVGAQGGFAGQDEGIHRDYCSIRAVRWTGRVPAVLNTPAGSWSSAYAENNLGTAVGVVATLTAAPEGLCPTVTRRAAAWDAAGRLTLLAPAYPGETVATGVNDIGEVVGVAVPPNAPANTGYAVRFAGGDVLPLGTGPSPYRSRVNCSPVSCRTRRPRTSPTWPRAIAPSVSARRAPSPAHRGTWRSSTRDPRTRREPCRRCTRSAAARWP